MFRIKVKNFQAVEEAELEVSGLTVLTGQNNGGKSVMVRAFKGVVMNSPAKSFVRKGEKSLSVELTFDSGDKVLWEKGGTLNQYTVNGKTLASVGAGVPDEVQALGILPVEAGGQTLWPQIAPALEGPLFLLDKTSSVFAEAVSDTERVGVLADAIREAESDIRSDRSESKVRVKDLITARSRLDRFARLPRLAEKVEDLKKAHAQGVKIQEGIEKVKAWKSALLRHRQIIDAYQGIEGITISDVQGVTEIESVEKLATVISKLVNLQRKVSHVESVELPHVDPFSLDETISLRRSLVSLRETVSVNVEEIPTLKDPERLFAILDVCLQYQTADNTIDTLTTEYERAVEECTRCHSEIESLKVELGNCPLCGSEWHETSLENGHSLL